MSAARTLGARVARGDYIGFLDADDMRLPEKIAEQVDALEAHPEAGMVYGRTQMWHSWDPNAARSDHSFDLGVEPERRPAGQGPRLRCRLHDRRGAISWRSSPHALPRVPAEEMAPGDFTKMLADLLGR
jgi:glycosyltransferase involved in cell wall biosynthesis